MDDSDSDDFDEEDSPTGNTADDESDDDVDYTGFSLLTGDLFDDILEDEDDTPDPVPARKVPKVKKGSVKKPEDIINSASPEQNEVDGTLGNTESSVDDKRPQGASSIEANQESLEELDDESEEEEDGILSLVSSFLGKYHSSQPFKYSKQV